MPQRHLVKRGEGTHNSPRAWPTVGTVHCLPEEWASSGMHHTVQVPKDRLLEQGLAAFYSIPKPSSSSAVVVCRDNNMLKARKLSRRWPETKTGLAEGGNSRFYIFSPKVTVFPALFHPDPPKSTLPFVIFITLSLVSPASFFTGVCLAITCSVC